MASKVAPARTADTMLKRIEEFLLTAPSGERQMLWDILTALRGPDTTPTDDSSSVKELTTAHIRTLAFPLLAREEVVSFTNGSQFASRASARNGFGTIIGERVSPHFAGHLMDAKFALRKIGRLPAKGPAQ